MKFNKITKRINYVYIKYIINEVTLLECTEVFV